MTPRKKVLIFMQEDIDGDTFVCAEYEAPEGESQLSNLEVKHRFRFYTSIDAQLAQVCIDCRVFAVGGSKVGERWAEVAQKMKEQYGHNVRAQTCRRRIDDLIKYHQQDERERGKLSGTEHDITTLMLCLEQLVEMKVEASEMKASGREKLDRLRFF